MKYLKNFNESIDDDKYVSQMIADLDDYEWTTSAKTIYSTEFKQNGSYYVECTTDKEQILIEIKKENTKSDYIDLQTIKEKMDQVLFQIKNYEIYSISIRFRLGNEGTGSYFLAKNLTSEKKEKARRQGYTSSDSLNNLDKYINMNKNYDLVMVVIAEKEKEISKIKKFFNKFK